VSIHGPVVAYTVYVVVVRGVTVMVFVLLFPGYHIKLVAPDAVNVAEPPTQIEVLVAEIDTVHAGLIKTERTNNRLSRRNFLMTGFFG
jgi:hypothetical protein